MQNKANLQDGQMNVKLNMTKDYGNFRLYGRLRNKPKQSQFFFFPVANPANPALYSENTDT